ncbi:MAG TPA: GGDEF domain-containing protein [Hyphomonadaceae bacterium]|nr:GGDEF domain-containing protein [Hyphomonadaceae bacterium]
MSNPPRPDRHNAMMMDGALLDAAPEHLRAAIQRLIDERDDLQLTLATLRAERDAAQSLADKDPLTPTLNRRAFLRESARAQSILMRYGAPTSVIFIDLNRFKAINDRYGHQIGDRVLIAAAHTLLANVRDSDCVGRIGGDEFAVLLAHTDEDVANEKAEMLVDLLAACSVEVGGERIYIEATAGAAGLRLGESVDLTLARADEAMYARKPLLGSDAASR